MQNDPETAKPDRLSPKQVRALSFLLQGYSQSETARQVGIGRATIVRWMRDPAFSAALDVAEKSALSELSNLLGTLSRNAAVTLGQILSDKRCSEATRVRACGIILSRRLQAVGLIDIERSLRELEAAVGADSDPGWGGDDDE